MKKYLVIPGYVTSKTDRNIHYITFHRLVKLYRVDPKECVDSRNRQHSYTGLKVLMPRYDGNYTLPE